MTPPFSHAASLLARLYIGLLFVFSTDVCNAQFEEDIAVPAAKPPMEDKAKPQEKDEGPVIEIDRSEKDIPPRRVRLHLGDGSVIAGELSVDEIKVATEFGELVIPVEKIVSFKPGLESQPQLLKKLNKLIEDLGADDFSTREQAHKELTAMGLPLREELAQRDPGENMERKRHLEQIVKELEQLAEEEEDFEENSDAEVWIREDSIVTTKFTIVGRILNEEFKIASKYGPLNVRLSDVRRAERPTGEKDSVRRSVTVSGTNLVQQSFQSTRLRVEKGDKITVRAEGSIVMTPWGGGHQTTPDGGAFYGWYIPNEIEGGALVARIGSSGKVFKVGSRKTFTAERSGVLEFAVAMQGQYASQGYQFPGQYTVKVEVEPK